jgi:hypothetical protein
MCTEAEYVIHQYTKALVVEVLIKQTINWHINTVVACIIAHLDQYSYFWTTSVCTCCHPFLYS